MSANVLHLIAKPAADRAEIVEFLQDLLTMAREGRITTIAAGWITDARQLTHGWVSADDPDLRAAGAEIADAVKEEFSDRWELDYGPA